MDIITRIGNLEEQVKNLASRPYNARTEEAKTTALTVDMKAEEIDLEVADTLLLIAELMKGD